MMANFQPPYTSSTTTTSSSSPFSTMEGSSSQLSHNPVLSNLQPNPHWQQQPPYFSCPQPMCPSPVPSSDAMVSRMVRQRRRKILKAKKDARAAASSTSSSSSRLAVERDLSSIGSETQNEQQLYPFCTSDNKKLRLLFKKELKNSDVGSLGRIVLPKKEAENYLPSLSDKEGIELRIRDALSTHEWCLKYKYWKNNKGRMYVLENTGDFVRETGVEVGDSIHLYEDECNNLYISIHRQRAGPTQAVQPSSTSYHQQNYTDINTNTTINNTNCLANTTSIHTPYAYNKTKTDEDENSSTVLAETNDMVTLFTDPAPSYRQSEEANNSNNNVTAQQQTSTHQPAMAKMFGSSTSSSPSMVKISEDNFGDCYEGLGTLPEVVHRFEYDFDDIMRDESEDDHIL